MTPPKQLGVLSNELALGTYIFILTFQGLCASINGYIIYLFLSRKDLRKNKSMRLIIFLSIGDFLLAIGELPYIIYMTINWHSDQLDYDPWFIMIGAQPLPLQLKISATTTVGIALGRNIALFFPSLFRKMDQGDFGNGVIVIALLFAVFDDFLYWYTTTIEHHLNCGTIGCFVSEQFRYYWGISNMILGFMAVFLSISIFWKLTLMSKSKEGQQSSAKYAKANRTSTGILISSLLFLTLPSVCVGVVELSGFSIFKLVGPFYSACLLVSGVCNGIIFLASNWDNVRSKAKASSSVMVHKLSIVPSTAHSTGQWH